MNVTEGSRVPSTPGCPRIVKVIGTNVSITWTQPDSDGGSKITGYLVIYATVSGSRSMAQLVTVGVTTTAKLDKSITRGTSYVIAVAAKNARGFSDFSDLSDEVKIPSDTHGISSVAFLCYEHYICINSKEFHFSDFILYGIKYVEYKMGH